MTNMTDGKQAEGFSVWPVQGLFVPSFATMLFRRSEQHLIFRIEVHPIHCNGNGVAHGGFISTMADIWLGYNIAQQLPEKARFTTANLCVDFLKPVRAGTWLESTIDRIKMGKRLCHASGAILADEEPVAAMRASFALLARS